MADKTTIPVCNKNIDGFEIVETVKEKVVETMDLNDPKQQVIIGGASGWVVGYLFTKFGKGIASAVGGGLILIQLANKSGYVQIDWRKINKDKKQIQDNIVTDIERNPQLKSFMSKVKTQCKENAPITIGFVGGILIGMAT